MQASPLLSNAPATLACEQSLAGTRGAHTPYGTGAVQLTIKGGLCLSKSSKTARYVRPSVRYRCTPGEGSVDLPPPITSLCCLSRSDLPSGSTPFASHVGWLGRDAGSRPRLPIAEVEGSAAETATPRACTFGPRPSCEFGRPRAASQAGLYPVQQG